MGRCGGTLIGPDVILGAAHCGNFIGEDIHIGTTKTEIVAERFNLNNLALYRLASPVDNISSKNGMTLSLNTDCSQPKPGQALMAINGEIRRKTGVLSTQVT